VNQLPDSSAAQQMLGHRQCTGQDRSAGKAEPVQECGKKKRWRNDVWSSVTSLVTSLLHFFALLFFFVALFCTLEAIAVPSPIG